jgi:hypothetical protein
VTSAVRALRAWSPWAPGEALRWAAMGIAGHAMWVVAMVSAQHEASFGHQMKWVTLGAGGFVVAAYADLTWLLRARWAIQQRRQALLPDIEGAVATAVAAGAPVERTGTDAVVAGTGFDRFHQADCPLAVGKGWPELDRATAEAEGRRPCGVCAP